MNIKLLIVLAYLAVWCGCTSSRLDSLQVVREDFYPKAFFFRGCEGWPSRENADWQEWDARYSRLMGIMGKCLDEEVLGREAKNPEWFTRFKIAHPEQVVLLHFNGNARDPRHGTKQYFAGHWIYRRAVSITADLPAQNGKSVVKVDDVSDFKVGGGRYRTSSDDIAFFGITADGRHDWHYCEQVRLLAVDRKNSTITVERGCYGTKPLPFKAGRSRAAAHEVEGPWGQKNNIMWFYNFATHCPLDADGYSCADRLVDDLAAWFGEDGKLAAFDGLEFDVLHHITHGDTNGDGTEDNGIHNGVNAYGAGVYNFAAQLRERLGRDTIIQGDGALGPGGIRSHRANNSLNGIESEGWPNLRDWEFDDWSGGLNRHNFWQRNSFKPAFSYINHKWIEPVPGHPGIHKHPQVPFSRHRLALASAQFTDSVVTFAFAPPQKRGRGTGIWDELNCGADNRIGWLGAPQHDTVLLAARTPNLLNGIDIAGKLTGDVIVTTTREGLLVKPANPDCNDLIFRLQDIPTSGYDLTVFTKLSAYPQSNYPAGMPRYASVSVEGGSINLMDETINDDFTGECLRGESEKPLDSESGAKVRYQRATNVGMHSRNAYAVHPPFKTGKGYVFWTREINLPAHAYDLKFALAMGEKAPLKSDGVWFSVLIAEFNDGRPGKFTKIFETNTKAHEWLPCSVSLARWNGKKVQLKFVSDCGPQNNTTTDQGYWGDLMLVRCGLTEEQITPAKSYMTWLSSEPFDASFYYREVRSPKVDLVFSIEGSAPVLLHTLSAHAAPDTRARVFENGVVLGNPGHKPYTFNLSEFAPGMQLRRIMATELQDQKVNTGESVGKNVTLQPLDGLFLVREE
jgi:hypothetical protein